MRRLVPVLSAVAMAVAVPAAVAWSLASGDLFGAVFTAAFAVYGAVGLLIEWNRPGNRIGRLFLLLGVAVPAGMLSALYAIQGLPGGPWMGVLSSTSNAVVFGGLFIFLPLLFPTGRYLSSSWRRFGRLALAVLTVMAVVLSLAPGTLDCCPGVTNPIRIPGTDALRPVVPFLFPVLALMAAGAFVSVVLRYRRSKGHERLQLKWFVFAVGFVVLAALGGGLASAGIIEDSDLAPLIVFPGAAGGIAVAVGVAVLKHRLYDIDLVINKALVYGALAAFITAVYIGVVVGIGALVGGRGEPNLALQVAATALVAVLFQPVRERIQHVANRLVYGERATPYEVMADFGDRMAASLRVEEVLPRMAEAAARGVGAAAALVTLRLPGGGTQKVSWPAEAGAARFDHAVAVSHQGETLGEIAVGKAAGDPFRPAEESLLRDLAGQAGLAFHNVRLTLELEARLEEISRQAEDLRTSQQRIVTAADDERRRLEQTIEARVERRIDALSGTFREARVLLERDPEAAAAALERTGAEAQATLEELREIARGIYPPLLADKGLAAALEAQVRKASVPVVLDLDGVSRYGPEVEAGLYFCLLEVIRGAGTRTAIRLAQDEGSVRLAIEHEGGLPSEAITRIQDRVEALGGLVRVAPDGQAIEAAVPAAVLEAAS
jgi:signal transduction histidine kinase